MTTRKTKSYYDVLDVDKRATDKDIRQAFRRLARKYHPDLNPDDKEAEAKFKEINEANEVLSDAESRKKYDQYGDDWKSARTSLSRTTGGRGSGRTHTWSTDEDFDPDPFGGFEDLFRRSRRSRNETTSRPQRLELDIEVTLEEAYLGSKRHGDDHAGRDESAGSRSIFRREWIPVRW